MIGENESFVIIPGEGSVSFLSTPLVFSTSDAIHVRYLDRASDLWGIELGRALHQSEDHWFQRARQSSLQGCDHVLKKKTVLPDCIKCVPFCQNHHIIRAGPTIPSSPSFHMRKRSLFFGSRFALLGRQWWSAHPPLMEMWNRFTRYMRQTDAMQPININTV